MMSLSGIKKLKFMDFLVTDIRHVEPTLHLQDTVKVIHICIKQKTSCHISASNFPVAFLNTQS